MTIAAGKDLMPLFVSQVISWPAAMYHYLFISSRVAPICCGAGWQPAADWQSACWQRLRRPEQRQRCLRLAAMWGRLLTCDRLAIGLTQATEALEVLRKIKRPITNRPQVNNLPHKDLSATICLAAAYQEIQ
jgi:hypothetical protein